MCSRRFLLTLSFLGTAGLAEVSNRLRLKFLRSEYVEPGQVSLKRGLLMAVVTLSCMS